MRHYHITDRLRFQENPENFGPGESAINLYEKTAKNLRKSLIFLQDYSILVNVVALIV